LVFDQRSGRTFSTAEIMKLMLRESDIIEGSVLPNDHGEGNKGACWCVGTDRQILTELDAGNTAFEIFDGSQTRQGLPPP
jgi:hypothetical protein